ncbi:DUF3619 family protein [Actimicrobium sp. CCI2.3]|uniref:DUF3619 family protein n=1 Tax=Actimicrobium sp. CCI2.3 TaxID=3048616 RepID=UPI002AB406E7|nr:DUF3619 family protein [Actimicrobium sp. CCI2.3]MDY7574270.1 DUF3619 family protein [Actimicrobium sp. CCI2.3]MEB0022730.1 DUF3619 family protein [Actimicrobium sp. CCI2.3]
MNTRELNFAYKVRHALNENLDNLPKATTDRLAAARKKALSVKRQDSPLKVFATEHALAGAAAGLISKTSPWFNRIGLILPLLALVAGLSGMYQFEKQQRISDTAEIDAAVLSDELPLSAYLDNGFSAYLAKQTN